MPDAWVLDASAALKLFRPDEAGHEEALRAMDRIFSAGGELIAPDLYCYETGNVISRGRGSEAEKTRMHHLALELVTVRQLGLAELARAMELSLQRKVSFYDAAYATLAEATRGRLWTEDRELKKRFPNLAASAREILDEGA